jgi:hypothetical protein
MCVCEKVYVRVQACDHKYREGNEGDVPWRGEGMGWLFAEGEDENTIIYEEGNE